MGVKYAKQNLKTYYKKLIVGHWYLIRSNSPHKMANWAQFGPILTPFHPHNFWSPMFLVRPTVSLSVRINSARGPLKNKFSIWASITYHMCVVNSKPSWGANQRDFLSMREHGFDMLQYENLVLFTKIQWILKFQIYYFKLFCVLVILFLVKLSYFLGALRICRGIFSNLIFHFRIRDIFESSNFW